MTLIYQVTDTHVDEDPGTTASRNFTTLMQYVAEHTADLLVISGDLPGEDGSKAIYEWMKSQIPASQPTLVIPGNHDDSAALFEVFESDHNTRRDFFEHRPLSDIDLLFANTESTYLPKEQLDRICAGNIRPGSILFIHHPTREVSGGFMDLTYPLKNWQEVHAALDASKINHVFCGHYHTEAVLQSQYDLYVTPSPAFKVDPDSVEIKISAPDVPLRKIQIDDNAVSTEMVFL